MGTKKVCRLRFSLTPQTVCHLGTVRLVLLNNLITRQKKGKLVFRYDDLESGTLTRKQETQTIESLRWLGLTWDEGVDVGGDYGPYRQSERRAMYQKYVEKLVDEGKAYECFCTSGELEYARKQSLRSGLPPKYNEKCRFLSETEKNEYRKSGRKPVLRLRVAEQEVGFEDLVLGEVVADIAEFGDFVIVKADGSPMPNFASVIDDHLMKITHVLRGHDHLANTYRQLMVISQLGIQSPVLAHVPILVNQDQSRLSKKYGSVVLNELREMGFLAEAIVHLLALAELGPGIGLEKPFSLEAFAKKYKLGPGEGTQVVLPREQLADINIMHINKLRLQELVGRLSPFLAKVRFPNEHVMLRTLSALQPGLKRLDEIGQRLSFLASSRYDYQREYFPVTSRDEVRGLVDSLKVLAQKLRELPEWRGEEAERLVKEVAEARGEDTRLAKSVMVALTFGGSELGLPVIVELLGPEVTLKRFDLVLAFLKAECR